MSSNNLIEAISKLMDGKLCKVFNDYLDTSDACLFLSVSKSHLYKLTHNKQIPYFKTGKKIYFKREDLEDYITKNRVMSRSEIDELVLKHSKAS